MNSTNSNPRLKDEMDLTMSDKTLVLNVEELIGLCFGPTGTNVANFKLMETVLLYLARQMRLLQQDVEIMFDTDLDMMMAQKEEEKHSTDTSSSEENRASSSYSKKKQTTDKTYGGKRTKEKLAKLKRGEVHDSSSIDGMHGRSRKKKTGEISKYGDTDQRYRSSKDDSMDESEKKGRSGKPSRKEKKADDSSGFDEKRRHKHVRDIHIDKIQDKMSEDHASTETTDYTQPAGLTVSKVIRKRGKASKDTILIVEKGPTTRDSVTGRGQIDMVTRSQFDILKANVGKLMTVKAPKPVPTLPDNKKMRKDLASGSATLPDAMEATQLNARIKATEDKLTRMADLLTQLAAMGAFPPEMSDLFAKFVEEQQKMAGIAAVMEDGSTKTSQEVSPSISHKSVAIDPMVLAKTGASQAAVTETGTSKMFTFSQDPNTLVLQSELQDALEEMRNELNKKMDMVITKSTGKTERARNLAQAIEEKLRGPLQVDERIDVLTSIITDYFEQLHGFNSGVTIQLLSFHEQMAQIRSELQEGLQNLDSIGKAENAGVLELRNYHGKMSIVLKESQILHTKLVATQEEITEKVKNQLECLEKLREDKADREELDDGLRDKADISRLTVLLNEGAFEKTRTDLLNRMSLCYDKFKKQDAVWLIALNDLMEVNNNKADMSLFLELREYTANELTQIHKDLRNLETMLGQPKAAILTRLITSDTHDKTLVVPELMAPCDDSGKPPRDVLTLDYPVDDGPCLKEIRTKPTEDRQVVCKRRVGGSHTILTEYTTRREAQPLRIQIMPTKRYCSFGTDGRLYMMEEELQPCIECNQIPMKESRIEVGDGDQRPRDKDLGIEEKVSIASDK